MIRKFPMKSDFLKTEDLAKYINITPKGWNIRRSKNDGPPFIKDKNEVRYLWEDVLKWIAKESSNKRTSNKKNKLFQERFEQIKLQQPTIGNKRIAYILSSELDLSPKTSIKYIYDYLAEKKQKLISPNERVKEDIQESREEDIESKIYPSSFHPSQGICKKYDEIKKENKNYISNYAIARTLSIEFNLSHSYVYSVIRRYVNKKTVPIMELEKEVLNTNTFSQDKCNSNLSKLGDAILNMFKLKSSIKNGPL